MGRDPLMILDKNRILSMGLDSNELLCYPWLYGTLFDKDYVLFLYDEGNIEEIENLEYALMRFKEIQNDRNNKRTLD